MDYAYEEAASRLEYYLDNQLVSPEGQLIIGTADIIPGTALALVYRENGMTEIEYDGETRMHWDGQTTKEIHGERCFVCEDENIWRESQLLTKAQYLNLLQLKSLSPAVNPQ